MGTPDFAVPTLRALHKAGHRVAAVYAQRPKPAGRGQYEQKTPVHEAAEALGLNVRTPRTLRDAAEQDFLAALNLDAIVVVAYGLILPQAVLDAPRLGCLNVHFSLLPRWRGAAPVPRALLAGDSETGLCIMQMAAGLDTGDVLLRHAMPMPPDATTTSLLADLGELGASMTLQALEDSNANGLTPQPQTEEGMTYAAKLTREDGAMDWRQPAIFLERQVRALTPWPGTYFQYGAEQIKVLQARIVPDQSGEAGTLLDAHLTIACGDQALRLLTVQRAGKKPTDGASLLRGLRLPEGHKFSLP